MDSTTHTPLVISGAGSPLLAMVCVSGVSAARAQVSITVSNPIQVDTEFASGGFECAVAVDKCNPDNVVGV